MISASSIFLFAAIATVIAFGRDIITQVQKHRAAQGAKERDAVKLPVEITRDAVALQSLILEDMRKALEAARADLEERERELAAKDAEIAQKERQIEALYVVIGRMRTSAHTPEGNR